LIIPKDLEYDAGAEGGWGESKLQKTKPRITHNVNIININRVRERQIDMGMKAGYESWATILVDFRCDRRVSASKRLSLWTGSSDHKS
jgi:hypothetical protein